MDWLGCLHCAVRCGVVASARRPRCCFCARALSARAPRAARLPAQSRGRCVEAAERSFRQEAL
eukprot:364777-Chlamydomonas_euryale.AAC.7